MNTLSLAIRNLRRNRRRSVATLLAMSIGLAAVLVFGGYAANIILSLQTAVIKRSGHLQIQKKGYFLDGSDNPVAYGFADYEDLIRRFSRDPVLAPMLNVVTPTLEFGGVAGNYRSGVSRSVLASGVEAEHRNRMFAWNAYGIADYAAPLALEGEGPDAAVIGEGVARKLQLCEQFHVAGCKQAETPARQDTVDGRREDGGEIPGVVAALSALEANGGASEPATRIELLTSNARGAPNVASLNVIAVANLGIKEWDDVYFVMHLDKAQRLVFGTGKPMVTAIMIQLKQTSMLPEASARVKQILAEAGRDTKLEVLDFAELNPMYGQSLRFMLSVFTFIAVLIGVIVVFTAGNTMSTAVSERTVEIGTLRAIGIRMAGIRSMFVAEGALLGVAGSVVGVAAAVVVGFLISHSGLTWTPPGHVTSYLIQISVLENLSLVGISALCLVAVAAISAWWPAGRAARLRIVDALRHA